MFLPHQIHQHREFYLARFGLLPDKHEKNKRRGKGLDCTCRVMIRMIGHRVKFGNGEIKRYENGKQYCIGDRIHGFFWGKIGQGIVGVMDIKGTSWRDRCELLQSGTLQLRL